jgi:hypothetical protein
MWPDRTYVLFTYQRLKDVRIVYVPPFSLGCFGGDTDNARAPAHPPHMHTTPTTPALSPASHVRAAERACAYSAHV